VNKNREISIASLSFIDLLTVSIGGLGVAVVFGALAFLKSSEAPKPIKIRTMEVPPIEINQPINFAFSATGGLEPYLWGIVEKGMCDEEGVEYGIPPGLSLDKDGRLSGTVDNNRLSNTQFCAYIKVSTIATNNKLKDVVADLENKYRSGEFSEKEFLTKKESYTKAIKKFKINIVPPSNDSGSRIILKNIPKLIAGKSAKINYILTESFGKQHVELESAIVKTRRGTSIPIKRYITIENGTIHLESLEPGKLILNFIVITKRFPFKTIKKTLQVALDVIAGEIQDGVLEILGDELPVATEHIRYYHRFFAKGGVPSFHWKVSGLPKGLILNPETGIVNGKTDDVVSSEEDSRKFALTVRVTDKVGAQSKPKNYILKVRQRQTKVLDLKIETKQKELNRQRYYMGKPSSIYFRGNGGVRPYTWEVFRIVDTSEDRAIFPINDSKLNFVGSKLTIKPIEVGKVHFSVHLIDDEQLEKPVEKKYHIEVERKPIKLVYEDKYIIPLRNYNYEKGTEVIIRADEGIPPFKAILTIPRQIIVNSEHEHTISSNEESSEYRFNNVRSKLKMKLIAKSFFKTDIVKIKYQDTVGTTAIGKFNVSIKKKQKESQEKTNASNEIVQPQLPSKPDTSNSIISKPIITSPHYIYIYGKEKLQRRLGCSIFKNSTCIIDYGIVGLPYNSRIVSLPDNSTVTVSVTSKDKMPSGLNFTGTDGVYYIKGIPDVCGEFVIPLMFYDSATKDKTPVNFEIEIKCRFRTILDIVKSYFL
jgi:hypothetical protein